MCGESHLMCGFSGVFHVKIWGMSWQWAGFSHVNVTGLQGGCGLTGLSGY